MELLSKRLEIDLLKQTDTMIYFMWNKSAGNCRVTRNGEVIYSGTRNSLKDEGLEKGELYTYTIERLNFNGNPIELIKMQTSTENKAGDCANCLQQIALTTIVSDSAIILAWGDIEGVEEYEIYRDGELLETIRKTQYTDDDVSMDKEYSYWIRGKRPLRKSDEHFRQEKFVVAKAFSLLNKNSSKAEPSMEEFWLTKKIAPPNQLLSGVNSQKPEEINSKWNFRYTTFLSEALMKSPNLLSRYHYFAGDDRGFDPESSRYRTQVNFSLQLKEKGAVLDYQKDIGISIAYNWRKKFRKAGIASSDGIELKKSAENARKVSVSLTHSVGNPLTASPNIDYEIMADFYRDGHYDIAGTHDQSPNHEVCLKNSDGGEWQQIHEAESKGLVWMARPIARQYWRISNFL